MEMNPKVYRLSDDGESWEMLPEVKVKYQAAIDSQLKDWVNGISRHTTNLPEGIEPECCPDFSCCNPDCAWDMDARKAFVNTGDEVRFHMLMGSLGALVESSAKANSGLANIHIAGQMPDVNDSVH